MHNLPRGHYHTDRAGGLSQPVDFHTCYLYGGSGDCRIGNANVSTRLISYTFSLDVAEEPPLNWQHAGLCQLREFLLREQSRGRFCPRPGLEL